MYSYTTIHVYVLYSPCLLSTFSFVICILKCIVWILYPPWKLAKEWAICHSGYVLLQYLVQPHSTSSPWNRPLSSIIPKHISHKFSAEMSQKSDVHVLDVLKKNETCHSDLVDIMHHYQSFLKDGFPKGHQLLSAGDLSTSERQMPGSTVSWWHQQNMPWLQPQVENWWLFYWWALKINIHKKYLLDVCFEK